ncbi:MAG: hypothetical protein IKV97_03520 [Clostridia bacterium]|nr:hypothetical protein [Clostridia bacterium]
MEFNEYTPRTMVGNIVDGIELDRVLVERICMEYIERQGVDGPLDVSANWMFIVGIYESEGKYYLLLEANDHSSVIDDMIERNLFPNTGLSLISEERALELVSIISDLGKEYFAYNISNFRELINLLVLSVGCRVRFATLFGKSGYYDKTRQEIVIANNTSQIGMIGSLVHECIHFFVNSKRTPPHTNVDYFFDEEEYLCNSVARIIITQCLGNDFVKNIIESAYLKVQQMALNNAENVVLLPEESLFLENEILDKCFKHTRDLQSTIDFYTTCVEKMLKSEADNKIIMDVDCSQSGFVELSRADNNLLYDIIKNEISPML